MIYKAPSSGLEMYHADQIQLQLCYNVFFLTKQLYYFL